jgi:hypothetical protein
MYPHDAKQRNSFAHHAFLAAPILVRVAVAHTEIGDSTLPLACIARK